MKKRQSVLFIIVLSLAFVNLSFTSDAQYDVNYDGKVGLEEAIFALQVTAGIKEVSDPQGIQEAIDSLPSDGGTILIKAGTYVLTAGIHINRSNVTLTGENGTYLTLGDDVKQPVVLIGTDNQSPTEGDLIENIRISNIIIDGNKDNQGGEIPEYDPSRCVDPENPTSDTCWIRNNGIDIRTANNVWINGVNVHNALSGGVVASWKCKRIFISNSAFHHNSFDGIALYDSEDIQVSSSLCYENGKSGLSLDNDLKHVSFNGLIIKNNYDNGIFARNSEELGFYNCMICENANYGCFISNDPQVSDSGVKRLFFSGCSFISNGAFGLWLASTAADSPDNAVIGSIFMNNTSGCIKVDDGGALHALSNVCK